MSQTHLRVEFPTTLTLNHASFIIPLSPGIVLMCDASKYRSVFLVATVSNLLQCNAILTFDNPVLQYSSSHGSNPKTESPVIFKD